MAYLPKCAEIYKFCDQKIIRRDAIWVVDMIRTANLVYTFLFTEKMLTGGRQRLLFKNIC